MTVSSDRTLARALADERRAQLVEELRGGRDGLDAQELAQRLGIHPNTVRWHLGVLADAGAVSSRPAAPSARGRPRILYRLAPSAAGRHDEYRLLAAILSGTLAEGERGPERAEAAGRAWGRYLVERPLPLARLSDVDAVEQVGALLDDQGFAPEVAPDQIRMRRCPFHELAETQPEIVCAVHRGLIDGAFAELGAPLGVEELDVFVEPDLCVARLARRG